MVVVAIVGIISAIAVPQILPMLRVARARAATQLVASIVEDGRRRAVNEARCYRLTAPTAGQLALQRRSTTDCTNDAQFTTDGWDPAVRTINLDPGITVTLSDTAAVAAPNKIVFRPNSRLRGAGTLTATQYGARVLVTTAGPSFGAVDITRFGRTCIKLTLTAPPAIAAPVVCP